MKLTKKQVLAYISLFTDDEWREMLVKQLKTKGNKWYVRKLSKKDRQDTDYSHYLYNSIGYDDEIGIYWYETILKGKQVYEVNI